MRHEWQEDLDDGEAVVWSLVERHQYKVHALTVSISDGGPDGWSVETPLGQFGTTRTKAQAATKAREWMSEHRDPVEIVKLRFSDSVTGLLSGESHTLPTKDDDVVKWLETAMLRVVWFKLDWGAVVEVLRDIHDHTQHDWIIAVLKVLDNERAGLERYWRDGVKEREEDEERDRQIDDKRELLREVTPVSNADLVGQTVLVESFQDRDVLCCRKGQEHKKLRLKATTQQCQQVVAWALFNSKRDKYPLERRIVRTPKSRAYVFVEPCRVNILKHDEWYWVRLTWAGKQNSVRTAIAVVLDSLADHYDPETRVLRLKLREQLTNLGEILDYFDLNFIEDSGPYLVWSPVSMEPAESYVTADGERLSFPLSRLALMSMVDGDRRLYLMQTEEVVVRAVNDFGARPM